MLKNVEILKVKLSRCWLLTIIMKLAITFYSHIQTILDMAHASWVIGLSECKTINLFLSRVPLNRLNIIATHNILSWIQSILQWALTFMSNDWVLPLNIVLVVYQDSVLRGLRDFTRFLSHFDRSLFIGIYKFMRRYAGCLGIHIPFKIVLRW
jgi:hypothetical protein